MKESPEPITEQEARLRRGTLAVVPEDGLRQKLEKSARTGDPLTVKLGLDPTAPDIHLGFAVVLRKLRQFQDLGHRVVLIIGDYTALIGDPSGRSATRPVLTKAEVEANAATYVEQLTRILDPERTVVRHNGEWLGALDFAAVVGLAAQMTVAQVLQREDFARRWEARQPIRLHELLYPLAQAYDSVAIEADVELGGQDQTFNILAGRDLQREMGQEPQVALFLPLLVGLDGEKKMSKSLGNYIGIGEPPLDMYSKVMSLADPQMRDYFLLCTDVPEAEFDALIADAASGRRNPMEVKHRLAREIVAVYHGEPAATAATAEWTRIHSRHQLPTEMPEIVVPAAELTDGRLWIVRLIALCGFAKTNGEARRLIEGGGVRLDDERLTDWQAQVTVPDGAILQVGKKHFARLRLLD